MEKPTKAESRQRWAALRDLWNEFDPIGVMDDPSAPRDEYDAYVGPTLRLLEAGAGVEEIADYLESVVGERMGLKPDRAEAERFARLMEAWFRGGGEG